MEVKLLLVLILLLNTRTLIVKLVVFAVRVVLPDR
jgi:hypothetical protein